MRPPTKLGLWTIVKDIKMLLNKSKIIVIHDMIVNLRVKIT